MSVDIPVPVTVVVTDDGDFAYITTMASSGGGDVSSHSASLRTSSFIFGLAV